MIRIVSKYQTQEHLLSVQFNLFYLTILLYSIKHLILLSSDTGNQKKSVFRFRLKNTYRGYLISEKTCIQFVQLYLYLKFVISSYRPPINFCVIYIQSSFLKTISKKLKDLFSKLGMCEP